MVIFQLDKLKFYNYKSGICHSPGVPFHNPVGMYLHTYMKISEQSKTFDPEGHQNKELTSPIQDTAFSNY